MNSLSSLFKPESLNRRELTFKALAGLIGGAIGWLPVELASHNSHLGQAQTNWSVVAYYLTAALAAGIRDVYEHTAAAARRAQEARVRLEREFDVGPWLDRYVDIYRLITRRAAAPAAA